MIGIIKKAMGYKPWRAQGLGSQNMQYMSRAVGTKQAGGTEVHGGMPKLPPPHGDSRPLSNACGVRSRVGEEGWGKHSASFFVRVCFYMVLLVHWDTHVSAHVSSFQLFACMQLPYGMAPSRPAASRASTSACVKLNIHVTFQGHGRTIPTYCVLLHTHALLTMQTHKHKESCETLLGNHHFLATSSHKGYS
jgi:hypothetical protein